MGNFLYWPVILVGVAALFFGGRVLDYLSLPLKSGFYYCTDKEAYALDGKDLIHYEWWWNDDMMIKYRAQMVSAGDTWFHEPGWRKVKIYVPPLYRPILRLQVWWKYHRN